MNYPIIDAEIEKELPVDYWYLGVFRTSTRIAENDSYTCNWTVSKDITEVIEALNKTDNVDNKFILKFKLPFNDILNEEVQEPEVPKPD